MSDADTADADAAVVDDSDDLGFDAPDGATATIVTQGDPIRSFLTAIVKPLSLNEAKFRFSGDALDVRAVDPANVGMVDVTAPAEMFTAYHADDVTVGMPLDTDSGPSLKRALQYARKGHQGQNGDPVRIDVYEHGSATRVRVAIIRSDQQTKRVSEFFTVDPDLIRQEPDIPDLSLSYRADPDVAALADAVDDLKRYDHAWFSAADRTLVIGTSPTRNPSLAQYDPDDDDDPDVVDAIEFPNHAWAVDDPDGKVSDADGSMFSTAYLRDFAAALKASKADRVTLKFGDEFPALFDFQSNDHGFSGRYMVAPRISSQ